MEQYNRSRGTGHTTAMLNGALNTKNCTIVIHGTDMRYVLQDMCEGEKQQTITLSALADGKMVGQGIGPIVFDNHALFTLLSGLTSTIAILRKDNADLENKIKRVKDILS